MELKQDFGKRGRRGLLEGLPEQAFADAIMAGVEGGQEVHFLGSQPRHAALAAQEAGEDAGETRHGPHVPLPCRMKVDAQAASLLLQGGVFGPQGVEIVRWDGPSRRHGRRLGMTSLFPLVTSATAQVNAHRRVELDFIQGREGIVLDDHPIAAERRIDGEKQALQTHVREVLV